MKSVLALALVLILAGCGRRESTLRQKIVGNWEVTNSHGVITISSDGSFLSRFTGRTQSWAYEGTWLLKDGAIIVSTTKSNSVPCSDVLHCRIIRAEGNELVYELAGQTIALSRK